MGLAVAVVPLVHPTPMQTGGLQFPQCCLVLRVGWFAGRFSQHLFPPSACFRLSVCPSGGSLHVLAPLPVAECLAVSLCLPARAGGLAGPLLSGCSLRPGRPGPCVLVGVFRPWAIPCRCFLWVFTCALEATGLTLGLLPLPCWLWLALLGRKVQPGLHTLLTAACALGRCPPISPAPPPSSSGAAGRPWRGAQGAPPTWGLQVPVICTVTADPPHVAFGDWVKVLAEFFPIAVMCACCSRNTVQWCIITTVRLFPTLHSDTSRW